MTISRLPEFLEALARFDVGIYSRRADGVGRQQLAEDAALVSQIVTLAHASARFRRRRRGASDAGLRRLLAIADLFFEAQAYVLRHDKPRYEPYASVPLLRYVLGVDRQQPLARTQRQIWFVVQELIAGQIEFETAALAAGARWQKIQFDPTVSRARADAWMELRRTVPRPFAPGPVASSVPASRLESIAAESTGASVVRELIVFSQTRCHDEVAFLRSIQLAECLFWGTLSFVQRALVSLHLGQRQQALTLLRAATEFASPLVHVFQSVRIMPPEHFLGFRAATGDASAVQSQSWQLLDAHMYGVLDEKRPVLARVPEVRHILRLANPGFVPLVRVIERLGRSTLDEELCEAIVTLDHKLRAWRKFHERQLAGRENPGYLPAQSLGTGGTLGYAYLASHRPPRATHLAQQRGEPFESAQDGT